MSIFVLLLFLLIGILIWPIIKIGYQIYRINRKLRNAYRRASSGSAASSGPFGGTDGYDTRRPDKCRKRRIDPSVATNAEFVEIDVDPAEETARQYDQGSVSYKRRQQISDAEWEEID